MRVIPGGNREFDARIAGRDARTGIAVLRVAAAGPPTLPFGESARMLPVPSGVTSFRQPTAKASRIAAVDLKTAMMRPGTAVHFKVLRGGRPISRKSCNFRPASGAWSWWVAGRAGVRRRPARCGDIIQELNRQPATGAAQDERAIARPGPAPVPTLVNRGGNTRHLAAGSR